MEVGENEVMIDHEDVCIRGLSAGLVVEAVVEVGAAGAQGLVVIGSDVVPDVRVD